jgi:hypothetical protein
VVSSSVCAGNIQSLNQLSLARRMSQHVLLLYLNIAPCCFGSIWGPCYFKFSLASMVDVAVEQEDGVEGILSALKICDATNTGKGQQAGHPQTCRPLVSQCIFYTNNMLLSPGGNHLNLSSAKLLGCSAILG